MKNWLKRVIAPVVAVAMFGTVPSLARADSILNVFPSPTVTPVGLNFDWDYKVEVTSSATVQKNDFFVIRDFAGFVSAVSLPTDWALTTETTTAAISGTDGTTAGFVTDTSISNLRFTYTGSATLGPNITLGDFVVESVYGGKTNSAMIAMDHSLLIDSSTGAPFTSVNSDALLVAAAPLPSTASVGLCLLGGLGAWTLMRRRAVTAG